VQVPCTCLVHDHKELDFSNWTDATSANATNIQDIRVIKARATAAGKDPGLPDPIRIIYLRHNVVLLSALCGRDMWSSESRSLAEIKRKLGKKQKRRRFRGQINETTPKMT
jgi:hypothetical protein